MWILIRLVESHLILLLNMAISVFSYKQYANHKELVLKMLLNYSFIFVHFLGRGKKVLNNNWIWGFRSGQMTASGRLRSWIKKLRTLFMSKSESLHQKRRMIVTPQTVKKRDVPVINYYLLIPCCTHKLIRYCIWCRHDRLWRQMRVFFGHSTGRMPRYLLHIIYRITDNRVRSLI